MTNKEAIKIINNMPNYKPWEVEALGMAIKALAITSCIKEKCAYCPHCENCDVDDETLAIKALEQEPILDKIKAEINALEEGITSYHNDRPWIFKDEVLQIINKYKAESEDEYGR